MADYFFVFTILLTNKSNTVVKPVYFSMQVVSMKGLPNLLFFLVIYLFAVAIDSF